MNDKPALQTPGEKLSALRKAAGRSLAEVSEATKIPPPMLQAIEQDEYHKISGDLYVKSFLRAYAAEVGVEAEEILELYGNFTGTAAPVAPGAREPVWQEEEIQIKRLGLPWATIGLVAGGVLLAAGLLFFLLRGGEGGDTDQVAVSGAGGIRLESSREADTGVDSTASSAAGNSVVTSAGGERSQPVDAAPPEGGSGTADVAPVLLPAPAGSAGTLAIDGKTWQVVLRLICPETRQVAVKKDGERRFRSVDWPDAARPLPEKGIQAGRAYQVREGLVVFWGAEDHFSLQVDDPADIKVTVNGQYRDIGGLGPGQEIILNDPDVIQSNLPSARP